MNEDEESSDDVLTIEFGDTSEWEKPRASKPKDAGSAKKERQPRRYSKTARKAKVEVYRMLYQNAHSILAAFVGPEAALTDEQSRVVADAYVACEEYYGWTALDKHMPLVMLAVSIASVEIPIIKKAITPRLMQGKGQNNGAGSGSGKPVPNLVTR